MRSGGPVKRKDGREEPERPVREALWYSLRDAPEMRVPPSAHLFALLRNDRFDGNASPAVQR